MYKLYLDTVKKWTSPPSIFTLFHYHFLCETHSSFSPLQDTWLVSSLINITSSVAPPRDWSSILFRLRVLIIDPLDVMKISFVFVIWIRCHQSSQAQCQDTDRTPGRNSGNSEFAWTWDLASAYVLCPCCSSGPRGQKRSGRSVGARW